MLYRVGRWVHEVREGNEFQSSRKWKKYIVYCYNTETPTKSGYWTESSTGSYLIMAPHADDTEFSERFVWTVEKKDSYWIFTNEATIKKPLEASNPTGYKSAGASTLRRGNHRFVVERPHRLGVHLGRRLAQMSTK